MTPGDTEWASGEGAGAIQQSVLPCDATPARGSPRNAQATYRLNNNGYRGEDLDPKAAFRICVFGATQAFGHGVGDEECFGHLLKLHIAAALQLEPGQVNCLNFAAIGQSADYCVRTVYRQLPQVSSDLVVCCLPVPALMEYFDEDGHEALTLRDIKTGRADETPVALQAWADFYTPRMGRINYIKNLLMLQDFCKMRGLDYILATAHLPGDRDKIDYLASFNENLDPSAILEKKVFRNPQDTATTRRHAARRAHAAFAVAVLEQYATLLTLRGDLAIGGKISDYVQGIVRDDPDRRSNQEAPGQAAPGQGQMPSVPAKTLQDGAEARPRPDVRPKEYVPNATLTRCATDLTGKITYKLNSQGYRGEDLDPSAEFRICVVGESHAFGVGVKLDQCFATILKRHIAAAFDIGLEKVNVINLALGGQSAEYCVRTVYRHLTHTRADLLVCCVPFPQRTEYFWKRLGYRSLDLASLTPENLETAPIPLTAFADFYTHEMGLVSLMKNMLMLQDFCLRHGYDYVLATQHLTQDVRNADYLREFNAALRQVPILDDALFEVRPDKAVDRTHGGPRTHAAFAISVLDRYAKVLAGRGAQERATRLETYVNRLKQTDPDWAFCQRALPPSTTLGVSPAKALGLLDRLMRRPDKMK